MFTLPWTSTKGIYLNNWLAMNLTFRSYLTGTGWIQYIPSTSPPLLKLGLLIFWLNNFIPDSIWLSFLREFDYTLLAFLLLCLTASKVSILIGTVSFWPSCVILHPGWPSQNSLPSTYRYYFTIHARLKAQHERLNTFTLPTIKKRHVDGDPRHLPHYMIHITS